MMAEFNLQFAMFGLYAALLLAALDYRNFGFRRPLLLNLTMAMTLGVSTLLSIYAFAIHPNADKGMPPIFVSFAFASLIFALSLFNRHRFGYVFIVAAFALSIYSVESIYDIIDNENYSFENDFSQFYKPVCGEYLAKMTELLEKAKAEAAPGDPIMSKKFDYMVFDESSEIYLYLKKKYNYELRYRFDRKLVQKTPLNRLWGVYKIRREKHNFYTTAGLFKDVLMYCDDVSEADVRGALEKARARLEKNGAGGGPGAR